MEPISGLLFSLFKDQPDRGQWVIACLEGVWTKLLGERLAAACRPVQFENSHLLIEIKDREWEQTVRSVRSELMEKLRAATANEIKSIAFRKRSEAG